MIRRIFNIAAVFSLLLCLATVVLWVRSYWIEDRLNLDTRPAPTSNGFSAFVQWELRSGDGGIYIERLYHDSHDGIYLLLVPHPGFRHDTVDIQWMGFGGLTTRLGFGFDREQWVDGLTNNRGMYFVFPICSLPALTALLPLFWCLSASPRRTRISDICPSCSYSLIGNVSGVCPECGTAIVRASKPTLTDTPFTRPARTLGGIVIGFYCGLFSALLVIWLVGLTMNMFYFGDTSSREVLDRYVATGLISACLGAGTVVGGWVAGRRKGADYAIRKARRAGKN